MWGQRLGLHTASLRSPLLGEAGTWICPRRYPYGPDVVDAVAGGRNVTLQSGAIQMPIYAAPGMDPVDVGRQVEQALTGFFRRLAG